MNFIELGHNLAVLRKQKRIRQGQLAKDLGISRATISAIENGNGPDVGIKKILQIVDYLGFDLSLVEKSPFPTFDDLKHGADSHNE